MANLDLILRAKDQASPAIDKINRGLGGLGTGLTSTKALALGAVGGVAALGGALLSAGVSTAKTAKQIDNLTKRTRVNAREAQRINAVYKRWGFEIDDTTDLFQELNLLVSEAGRDNAKYVDSLNEIGLSYQDLISLSPEEQLYAIGDGLNAVSDGADRTFLASELLSDEIGGRFLTAFADGSQSVRMMADEMEAAGVVMDDLALNRGVQLNDQVEQMQTMWDGFMTQLGTTVLPLLVQLGEVALPLVAGALQIIAPILQGVIALLSPFTNALSKMIGAFTGGVTKALENTQTNVGTTADNIATIINNKHPALNEAGAGAGKAIGDGVIDSMETADTAIEDKLDAWADAVNTVIEQIESKTGQNLGTVTPISVRTTKGGAKIITRSYGGRIGQETGDDISSRYRGGAGLSPQELLNIGSGFAIPKDLGATPDFQIPSDFLPDGTTPDFKIPDEFLSDAPKLETRDERLARVFKKLEDERTRESNLLIDLYTKPRSPGDLGGGLIPLVKTETPKVSDIGITTDDPAKAVRDKIADYEYELGRVGDDQRRREELQKLRDTEVNRLAYLEAGGTPGLFGIGKVSPGTTPTGTRPTVSRTGGGGGTGGGNVYEVVVNTNVTVEGDVLVDDLEERIDAVVNDSYRRGIYEAIQQGGCG